MKNVAAIVKLREAIADPLEPENERVIATFYWRVLIVLSIVVLIGALLYGYNQFENAAGLFDTDVSTSRASTGFSGSALDSIIAVFDTRESQYEALKLAPLTDPDPSQ